VRDPGPGEIRFRRRELTVLRRLCLAAEPQEACALLLGGRAVAAPDPSPGGDAPPAWEPHPEDLEIRTVWPCLNIWEPASERPRRFLLDPREQLLAQRWARERELQVIGSAHSHPASAAVPSATDLDLACLPTLQLILSPLQDWVPACWWLEEQPDGAATARPLRWRMVD
jgi:proteasome lid subunit RPN8/RPN11